ncbi:MAG: zf-HC2 domain-containing protein [Verrucomicrobiales bacterium]|nr:zf-HC2 domain-containing protein [Verrucomicrobiales bacterium]
MRHPDSNAWMSWLYGETEAAETLELEAHLAVCPDCRARVDRWRQTMGHLDAAAGPRLETVRRRSVWPAVKWAAAAMILLASGIWIGRQTTAMNPMVAEGLRQWEAEWQTRTEAQRRRDLEVYSTQALAAMRAENQEILGELSRRILAGREEDRVAVLRLLEHVDRRRSEEIREIRDGLTVLATQTGAGLEKAESQMRLLAGTLEESFSQPRTTLPEAP